MEDPTPESRQADHADDATGTAGSVNTPEQDAPRAPEPNTIVIDVNVVLVNRARRLTPRQVIATQLLAGMINGAGVERKPYEHYLGAAFNLADKVLGYTG